MNNELNVQQENTVVVDKGPWKVFAKIGNIFGIISLITIIIPFVSCSLAAEGIIFSALGKKSTTKRAVAKKALTMNIVACVINFVISVVAYTIFLLTLEGLI